MGAVLQAEDSKLFITNPFVVVFAAVVLYFVSAIAGALLAGFYFSESTNQNYQSLALVIGQGLSLLLLITTAKRITGFNWRALGWRWPGLKGLLLVVPTALVYFIASAALTIVAMQLFQGFNAEQAQEVGFKGVQSVGERVAVFASLVILVPLIEEVIFRGVLFRGLRRRLPFIVSALLSSVLFAAAHLQWNVAIDTFVLGLAFCFLAERTNSILPTIALHAVKNGIAFLYLFILNS